MGIDILSGSSFTGWIANTATKDIVGVVNNANEATFCLPGIYNWTAPSNTSQYANPSLPGISAVCVSGGAAGSPSAGGNGGNLVTKNLSVVPGKNYLIVVGNGGATTSSPGSNTAILDSTVNTTVTTQNISSGEFIQTTPGLYATPMPSAITQTGYHSAYQQRILNVTNTTGILVGHTVTSAGGAGIPTGTVVTAIDATNKIVFVNQIMTATTYPSTTTYTFSYAGNGWQVPTGITSISVVMVGGGGAGGTGTAAGGGGGGALTWFAISGLTPGTYLNYQVGPGGSSPSQTGVNLAAGGTPTAGGNTQITINGTNYTANGGQGAQFNTSAGSSGLTGLANSYNGNGGGAGGYAGAGGNGFGINTYTATTPYIFQGGVGGLAMANPGTSGLISFGSNAGGKGGNGAASAATPTLTTSVGSAGTGGGGGGGGFYINWGTAITGFGGYGGGVGIYGTGANGTYVQGNTINGQFGGAGSGGNGYYYGGGGSPQFSNSGLSMGTFGGPGAIRIVYPATLYTFPTTNVSTTVPSSAISLMTLSSMPSLFNGFPIAFDTAIGGLSSNTIYYTNNVVGNTFNLSPTDQTASNLSFTSGLTITNVNLSYPTIRAAGAGSVNSTNLGQLGQGGVGNTSGGGGAGGYVSATGGAGGASGTNGSAGGGNSNSGGGGINLYSTGTSGGIGGIGGSGGYSASSTTGGLFGGGGGINGVGAGGAVRLIWGTNISGSISFPLNAATTNTTVPLGSVTVTSTLNGSPAIPTKTLVSSLNISNGIVTISNNPTSTGQAQFTVGAPTATTDTLTLNTNTNSKLISIPTNPSNYRYINTPVIANNSGLILSPKNSNYRVVELDIPGKDLSSELALITQPRSDSGGAARKTDQNLSTQEDVVNKIGWIGGTST